ncbi:hypothetical protein, partial [Actinacidiphila sp. bgisy167]|uniref:hypothetical protein n=1 Tax=Actinacidiphila sp. bgisy167 TaxID=3413797 RepID=UPI003D72C8DC
MPDFTKVCFAVEPDVATEIEQLSDARAQLAALAAHFERLEATVPQTGYRLRGPVYPAVDATVRSAWAEEAARAELHLSSLSPARREVVEREAGQIMSGRHQAPPIIRRDAIPGTTAGDYLAWHDTMRTLVAALLDRDPRSDLPLVERPAYLLSERLRRESGSHAVSGGPAGMWNQGGHRAVVPASSSSRAGETSSSRPENSTASRRRGPVLRGDGSALDKAIQNIVNAHGDRRQISAASQAWISQVETGDTPVTQYQAAWLKEVGIKAGKIMVVSTAMERHNKAAYARIAPEMEPYISREKPEDGLEDTVANYPYIAHPRKADGSLPDAAIDESRAISQWDLDHAMIDLRRNAVITVHNNVDDRALTLDQMLNYPELKSFTASHSSEGKRWDTNGDFGSKTLDYEGVKITFYSHKGDKLAQDGMRLTTEALSILRRAGYALPGQLNVYIPKYYRSLLVQGGERNGRNIVRIEATSASSTLDKDSLAEFMAPDNIVITAAIHTPPASSGGLRAIFDELVRPELGNVIHEMFHWLAHQHNPGHDTDLDFANFSDNKAHEFIATSVSTYAAENPAEFIAEYATARLFGAKTDPNLDSLYMTLGGAVQERPGVKPASPTPSEEEQHALQRKVARLTSGKLPGDPTPQQIRTAHRRLSEFETWLNIPERAARIAQIILGDAHLQLMPPPPPQSSAGGQQISTAGSSRQHSRTVELFHLVNLELGKLNKAPSTVEAVAAAHQALSRSLNYTRSDVRAQAGAVARHLLGLPPVGLRGAGRTQDTAGSNEQYTPLAGSSRQRTPQTPAAEKAEAELVDTSHPGRQLSEELDEEFTADSVLGHTTSSPHRLTA